MEDELEQDYTATPLPMPSTIGLKSSENKDFEVVLNDTIYATQEKPVVDEAALLYERYSNTKSTNTVKNTNAKPETSGFISVEPIFAKHTFLPSTVSENSRQEAAEKLIGNRVIKIEVINYDKITLTENTSMTQGEVSRRLVIYLDNGDVVEV